MPAAYFSIMESNRVSTCGTGTSCISRPICLGFFPEYIFLNLLTAKY